MRTEDRDSCLPSYRPYNGDFAKLLCTIDKGRTNKIPFSTSSNDHDIFIHTQSTNDRILAKIQNWIHHELRLTNKYLRRLKTVIKS